ncbi:oocyte zinc finger protein XlCOF28 [Phthorimaea operculella]|nr:oocyte zinc finger protein XlCOF28 [Phthorimaea operculella]
MDSKVCVNCSNKNAVNGTDNRLVTESCGHVKCMQCLLQEVSGCNACQKAGGAVKQIKEVAGKVPDSDALKLEPERKKAKLERAECVDNADDSLESNSQSDLAETAETVEEYQREDHESEKRKVKPSTEHIITEKDGKRECYLCTLCRRKFSARSQVTYHAYCNGEKKPFECRECKKRFATRSHYNYHMQSKHPTNCRGRYICEICDASFIQKSKLQRHKLVIHTKEKKYACKECGKAFNNACSSASTDSYTPGTSLHVSALPRLFRDSSNLKKHINNKHSSTVKPRPLASQPQSTESQAGTEVAVVQSAVAVAQNALALVASGRKHQCDSCQKSFHSGKDLRRHEKVHKDDKPFECKIRDMKCKQPRFRRLDNLNRHLRNTHGIVEPRPVTNGLAGTQHSQCPIRPVKVIIMCLDNLNRHLRNTHGIVEPRPVSNGLTSAQHARHRGTQACLQRTCKYIHHAYIPCGVGKGLFRRLDNLNRHLRNTHGIVEPRPVTNGLLKHLWRFRRLDNLNRHLRNTHGIVEPRPVTNGLAKHKRRFRRLDNLNRHLRNTHGIVEPRPVTNGLAKHKWLFRRLDNLNRHLRNTHGIVEPRPVTNGLNGTVTATVVEKDEVREKAKLEVLNPLPPLPDDFIQKHLYTEEKLVKNHRQRTDHRQ